MFQDMKIPYDRPTFDANNVMLLNVWFLAGIASAVVITGQTVNDDGRTSDFQYSFTPTINGALNQFPLYGVAGTLLWFQIIIQGTVYHGQCYCTVQIARGTPASYQYAYATLFAGYLQTANNVYYPDSVSENAGAGTGWFLSQNVSSPAAGAEWSFTVPSNTALRVWSIRYQLVTSVAVANRFPAVQWVPDGTNITYIAGIPQASPVTASLTVAVSHGVENGATGLIGTTATGTTYNAPCSNQLMFPNAIVRTGTANLQAADQYSAIYLAVEKWATP